MKKQKFSQLRTAISISLVLLMVFSLCPISAFAVSDEPYVPESPWVYDSGNEELRTDIEFHISQDGLWSYWVLSDGKSIELCYDLENFEYDAYLGDEANLVIPETIDGYTVTQIGEYAFTSDEFIDFSFLESVVIPDTVKYIGKSAFMDCTALESAIIGDSVTSIGEETFFGCTSLTSVTIPDSVTSIGYNAFNGCTSLTSVTIPDSVTSIGYDAFNGCSALTSVTIPDSVTSVGDRAFYGCSSLESVTIPDSVTSIGNNAFRDCTSLTSVTIPDSVTSIGYNAFYNCTSLTSITIPDSVKIIDERAFGGCKALTSIEIPDSVTSIGNYAFYNCTSLTSVTISDSVTSIGDFTFQDCTSLTSIEIPDSVTSIGYQAFNGCTALTDIYIPDSVTSIGNNAIPTTATVHAPEGSYTETYAETKGIPVDNNMEIPTESSDDIVTYTENNVTITVNKTTGDVAIEGVGAIPADFYRHFISTDTIAATLQEKLAEYYDTDVILIYSGIDDPMAFLAGSEYIDVATGDRLFVTDEMLEEFLKPSELLDFSPKTLVIGEGITEIPDYAFAFFSEVTEIVLPSTIKNIGEAAFAHCRGLEYIALPEAVESIYLGSFDGCANLTSISMTAYENASDALFYGTPANVMTTTGITENETPRRCVFHD